MRKWLMRLYKLDPYPQMLDRRQAVAAYVLATAGLLALMAVSLPDPDFLSFGPWVYASLTGMAILVATWAAIRQGRLRLARHALIAFVYLSVIFYPLISNHMLTSAIIQPVALVATVLLAPRRWVFVGILACYLGDIIIWTHLSPSVPSAELTSNLATIIGFNTLVGVLCYLLAQGWERGLAYVGEQTLLQRLRMVELNAEIAQRMFQRVDLDTLLSETVELVRSRFEKIYHAQIFLVDETTGQHALLRASTGAVGRELLRRAHQLEVGSLSVIGQVTVRAEPVLALDTSTNPVHRRNELLPDTRSELALPLISNERIIGALDVQSVQANAFTQDDIDVLQALANQIAVAIDNARLFAQQQRVIEENQSLAAQAQAHLAEIEALNRRLAGQAWGKFLGGQEIVPALTVDFTSGAMTPNAAWTPGLAKAAREGSLADRVVDDRHVLSVPIAVRGQVIGAMEFELGEAGDTDAPGHLPHELQSALAQGVAERLALAVENARLYEDAQRLARRETIINDISAQMQSASGVQTALAAAAQGLQNALDAPRVIIRLGTPPALNGDPSNGQEAQA